MSAPTSPPDIAIVCDLKVFTAEQREHHLAVSRTLFAAVHEVRELPDGYALRLPEESAWLLTLADFIGDERRCCAFWTFQIEVLPQGGPIWLHLRGPAGVKALMVAELVPLLDQEVAGAAGLKPAQG